MKYFAGFASMLVLLVAPAFGAGSKPQNVVIPQNVQVGSTQLPAGTYKLAYTGTGNVQVTLTQAGKTVLTFPAKEIDKNTVNPGVDLITNGGVTNLQAIHLSKVSFELNGAPQSGQ
jgi:hypothetical protein